MKQRLINQNIRKYFNLGTRTNKLTIERNASFRHEVVKALVFTKLIFEGNTVVCTGKLKNGNIPDLVIVDLEEPIAYEICESETKKRTKEKDYPFRKKRVEVKNYEEMFENLPVRLY